MGLSTGCGFGKKKDDSGRNVVISSVDPATLDITNLPWLPLDARNAFPKQSAIYFAVNSFDEIQYIGRSANPRMRWSQHHKFWDLQKIGNIKIAYLFLDVSLLPNTEKALIGYFKPPLNTVGINKSVSVRGDRKSEAHLRFQQSLNANNFKDFSDLALMTCQPNDFARLVDLLILDDCEEIEFRYHYPKWYDFLAKNIPSWIPLGLGYSCAIFFDYANHLSKDQTEAESRLFVSHVIKSAGILADDCVHNLRDYQDYGEDDGRSNVEFAIDWFADQLLIREISPVFVQTK